MTIRSHHCSHLLNLPFFSTIHLETLPLLRHIRLLQILRILIAQLEVHVLHRLIDPLLAAQSDDRTDSLLDAPGRSYTRHADIVLLRDLLDPLDDLLVRRELALVDE